MAAKNKQNGKFLPAYFPEIISTPASVELREFYLERRRQRPIRKQYRRYKRNAALLADLLEVSQ